MNGNRVDEMEMVQLEWFGLDMSGGEAGTAADYNHIFSDQQWLIEVWRSS